MKDKNFLKRLRKSLKEEDTRGNHMKKRALLKEIEIVEQRIKNASV